MNDTCGDATVDMLEQLFASGTQHVVMLMRHSAREFRRDIHDLLNPLTDEGRALAERLGQRLPADILVRGYASPPERCMETAELILAAHAARGGAVTRVRPLDALGVFYALDQQRLWKAMQAAGGLVAYMEQWLGGQVPSDAVMPAPLAASLVLRLLSGRLASPVDDRQLDVCVSHDMTVHLLRHQLLQQGAEFPEVAFLDALVLFENQGQLMLASHHGPAQPVRDELVLS